MARYNHNDIKIGDRVEVNSYAGVLTVTDIFGAGPRGISLTRSGDIHSKDRTFFDAADIVSVFR